MLSLGDSVHKVLKEMLCFLVHCPFADNCLPAYMSFGPSLWPSGYQQAADTFFAFLACVYSSLLFVVLKNMYSRNLGLTPTRMMNYHLLVKVDNLMVSM